MKQTALYSTLAAILCTPMAAVAADSELESLKQRIIQLEQKLDATAEAVDNQSSKGSSATKIGGYGEMHYNNLNQKQEIDFHRFVMFLSHSFNERISFHSELEVTHTTTGENKATDLNRRNGYVAVEMAYINLKLNQQHDLRTGIMLMPVGILNETHEPDTFYGVERNPVESFIIPTTWWEAGAGLQGRLTNALGYDFMVTSGLNTPTSGSNEFIARSGRQMASQAKANQPAYTARLRWTGLPGVTLSATVNHQVDFTQNAENIAATLAETHAIVQRGNFGLRALYAQWQIDGMMAEKANRDRQYGWYVEPSYKLREDIGVFARYNNWDNGGTGDTERRQTNVGVNYWAHPNVVFKADIQRADSANRKFNGFNLGVGYSF